MPGVVTNVTAMILIEFLVQCEQVSGITANQTRTRLAPDLRAAASEIVEFILAEEPATVCEASVRRPRRGRVWVATFTGPRGGQVWKSTGLTDRDQAVLLAKSWEAKARAERTKLGRTSRTPLLRVGRQQPGTPRSGLLTQKEVAMLLNMSERAVREIERRAIQKLRNHPLLRQVWRQYLAGELDEQHGVLTPKEIEALFGLANSPEELFLIQKTLGLLQR